MNTNVDPDMVMNAFRMMRDGGYKTAAELRKAIDENWPNKSKDQVDAVMRKLAEIARRMY